MEHQNLVANLFHNARLRFGGEGWFALGDEHYGSHEKKHYAMKHSKTISPCRSRYDFTLM
jgi:hypothetical protein